MLVLSFLPTLFITTLLTICKLDKLSRNFYLQADVVDLARQLLGKLIVTRFEGVITSGYITETEAYAGVIDRASHAYGGRRTPRTEIMYHQGGTAYVYLCYGMHSLFNVVSNVEGTPHAILIRAIEPVEGLEIMMQRANKTKIDQSFANGPGKVAKILGISTKHTDWDLCNSEIEIYDVHKIPVDVITSPRIGVDYAKDDAQLPYRFNAGRFE